jgi:hypothetical protein
MGVLHKKHIKSPEELIYFINNLIYHVSYKDLFDVRTPESDPKKIETYRSVREV